MISLYNVCSILCYFIKVGIFFNQTFELQSSRTYTGAGESIENLKFFRTDYIKPKETISDCTKIIENVIEGFQLKNGDKCSFSVLYDSIGLHHIYGFVYRVGDANYGIVHYDKRPKIWKIVEIENSRCTVIKE